MPTNNYPLIRAQAERAAQKALESRRQQIISTFETTLLSNEEQADADILRTPYHRDPATKDTVQSA